jgi:hypothetical protein
MGPHDERSVLADRLRADLLGPLSDDEVLECRPTDRYLTGILFPGDSETPPEEDEALAAGGGDEDEGGEEAVSLERTQRHSSAGISFAVRGEGGSAAIEIDVRAARYRAFWLDEKGQRSDIERPGSTTRWERVPLNVSPVSVVIRGEDPGPIDLTDAGGPGLTLRVHVASIARERSEFAVTVVLINSLRSEKGESRRTNQEKHFFQTGLRIRATGASRLIARPSRRSGEDEDLRLIYRDVHEFAVGHFCAARWVGAGEHGTIDEVATTWLPQAVVEATSTAGDPVLAVLGSTPGLEPLSAAWLSRAGEADLVRALRLLPDAYGEWLMRQKARIPGEVPGDLRDQAARHIADGEAARERIGGAIDLLARDAAVRRAFQLANRAMVLQRNWNKGDADLMWRPFQLAFQLLTLESLAIRRSPDRLLMDLLWFPTGGGKTEAYLGIIAFLLFHRRLTEEEPGRGAGTAVIMRYTLRLLTIQQFQRAASLILACEHIRRGPQGMATGLGDVPFSIGLWVGGGATPNTTADAEERLANDTDPSPRQITACPACQDSGHLKWRVDRRTTAKGKQVAERIVVACENQACPVRGDLPIWTVDEDIYREVPSLLIGTVDKFAQIVRKASETARFFGDGQPSHDPPDLIIQDELHLITGPLGTLTGIYEIAIDELCSRTVTGPEGPVTIRPKVIGSTATIRRAREQGLQLFNREVSQFPPAILDAANSCFAVRDTAAPGRLYVGVTSAGRSPKFTLQATCASLLQAVEVGGDRSKLDPWWTLVAYFNSLRELGGALVMMYDDVPASVRLYAALRSEGPRSTRNIDELTSRKKQSELRDTLAALDVRTPNPDALDAVLATNMISVGVDIQRLGLMVVNGQPKQIAEYIQATSRVGRSHPGLVVTVYNNGRVRDRSHFEAFSTWHAALYRDVEPSSVTPFASRARDRAIHAVLCALARHRITGLRTMPKLTSARRMELERTIVPAIVARATSLDRDEVQGVVDSLTALLDQWEERVRVWGNAEPKWWSDRMPTESLLISAETHAAQQAAGLPNSNAWATPNSMREVEPGTPLRLIERLRPEGADNAG